MKIIIDIDEKDFEYIHKTIKTNDTATPYFIAQHLWESVLNGIPLPKYHGRIVDINKMEYLKPLHATIHGKIAWTEAIKQIKKSIPTIVEAYREE